MPLISITIATVLYFVYCVSSFGDLEQITYLIYLKGKVSTELSIWHLQISWLMRERCCWEVHGALQ
jgi:hypothetical protein